MKSILEENSFNEIKNRLSQLQEDTPRQWGKMTPAQMACHCQGPLNIMLQKEDYGLTPNWLVNLLFKKSMYSDKLWRKNLPTVKIFKQTEDKNFEQEVTKLNSLINELGGQLDRDSWGKHPAFGDMTNEQWGKMQYKHLDHHLRQFGL